MVFLLSKWKVHNIEYLDRRSSMLLVPNPQTNGEFTQTEPSASESEDTVGDVNIVNNSNIVN